MTSWSCFENKMRSRTENLWQRAGPNRSTQRRVDAFSIHFHLSLKFFKPLYNRSVLWRPPAGARGLRTSPEFPEAKGPSQWTFTLFFNPSSRDPMDPTPSLLYRERRHTTGGCRDSKAFCLTGLRVRLRTRQCKEEQEETLQPQRVNSS